MANVPLNPVSSVVVTGPQSFAQNFSENAQNVLCQGAFGAGAYAIGSSLLGGPTPKPPQALLVGGALVAALSLCPSRPTQSGMFGQPPAASGGQCATSYDIEYGAVYYTSQSGQTSPLSAVASAVLGPLSIVKVPPEGLQASPDATRGLFITRGNGTQAAGFSASWGIVPGSLFVRYIRRDGLPDNCGSQASSGGSIISNPVSGDTINTTNVVDNSSNVYIVPVTFNLPSFDGVINLPFSNVRIGSFMPLVFDIEVGGIRYSFGQKPDGTLEPREVRPDTEEPADDRELLRKILAEVKRGADCSCQEQVELDMLFMPTVQPTSGCEVQSETLLVPKGSVSESLFDIFVETASLARDECLRRVPVQSPMTLVYSASTTSDGRELFSPKLEKEIVSLVLKITEVRSDGPRKIELYPASNQRKFGSVSYVLTTVDGGGDYIYIFDVETYIPLPPRIKDGRLRLLLKKGLSFELYDSGERV